jgi:phosphate transport system permease protein
MYALSSEGLYIGQAYASALVLLVVVIAINALSASLAKRLTKR